MECEHKYLIDGDFWYRCLLCSKKILSHLAIAIRLESGLFNSEMTEAQKTELLRMYISPAR